MKAVDIGVLDDFENGTPRQIRVADRVLVAVRIDECVYILDDRCSHEEFSLSEGEVNVDTGEIECARHGAMFRLIDGAAMTFPATRPVGHYDVQQRDGRLEVLVP